MRPTRGDTFAKGLGRLDTESGDPGEVLSAPPGAAAGCTFSRARPLGAPAAVACPEADRRAGEALSGEAVVCTTLQQGKGTCRTGACSCWLPGAKQRLGDLLSGEKLGQRQGQCRQRDTRLAKGQR